VHAALDLPGAVDASVQRAELEDARDDLEQQVARVHLGAVGVRAPLLDARRGLAREREPELLLDRLEVAVPGPRHPLDRARLHVAVAVPVEAQALAQPRVTVRAPERELGVLLGRGADDLVGHVHRAPVLQMQLARGVAVDPLAGELVIGGLVDAQQLVARRERGLVGDLRRDHSRLAIDEQRAQRALDVGLDGDLERVLVAHEPVEVRARLSTLAANRLARGRLQHDHRLGALARQRVEDRLEPVHERRVVAVAVVRARVGVVVLDRARERLVLELAYGPLRVGAEPPRRDCGADLLEERAPPLRRDAVAPELLAARGGRARVEVVAGEPPRVALQLRADAREQGRDIGRPRTSLEHGPRRRRIGRFGELDLHARVRPAADVLEHLHAGPSARHERLAADRLDAHAEVLALGCACELAVGFVVDDFHGNGVPSCRRGVSPTAADLPAYRRSRCFRVVCAALARSLSTPAATHVTFPRRAVDGATER
jgi:hypothetical protein